MSKVKAVATDNSSDIVLGVSKICDFYKNITKAIHTNEAFFHIVALQMWLIRQWKRSQRDEESN